MNQKGIVIVSIIINLITNNLCDNKNKLDLKRTDMTFLSPVFLLFPPVFLSLSSVACDSFFPNTMHILNSISIQLILFYLCLYS